MKMMGPFREIRFTAARMSALKVTDSNSVFKKRIMIRCMMLMKAGL